MNLFLNEEMIIIFVCMALNFGAIFGLTLHYDSWIVTRWLNDNQYNLLKNFYQEVGMPQHALILRHIWPFFRKNFQLAGVLLIVFKSIQGISIYYLLLNVFHLNLNISLIMTIFIILYPSQEFIHDLQIFVQYGMLWQIFIIGTTLFWWGLNNFSLKTLPLLIFVVIAILYSYAMKSILFLSPFIYGWFFYTLINSNQILNYFKLISVTLMMLLPIIYWYLNEKYFPRTNNFKNLNKFLPLKSILRIIAKVIEGLSQNSYGSFSDSLKILKKPETGLLVFATSLILTYWLELKNISIEDQFFDWKILFVGFLIILLSVIPYALVNQDFDSKGYLTKNSLMCDLGFGVCITQFVLFLAPSGLKMFFMIFLIFTFFAHNIVAQFNLWVQYAKQCELFFELQKLPDTCDLAFIIEDFSTLKQRGKKSKLYPMTLFYMANSRLKSYLSVGYQGEYESKTISSNIVKNLYDISLLPSKKLFFNPKNVYLIKIEDGSLTIFRVVKFIFEQSKKNPYMHEFKVKLFRFTTSKIS
jgi:hypothetical protein